jgi:hypothetical protein
MAIACKRRISSVAVALLLSSLSHDNAIAQTSIFDSPPARDKPAMDTRGPGKAAEGPDCCVRSAGVKH